MNDITALAQRMKGQAVNAPYYLAECMNCGEMMPSSKLVESKNYPDGDADCYCPHCNADDCDIADLGSGEEPASSAWNFQQKRIDALVEALEKAQRANTAQDDHINQQQDRIDTLEKRNTELGKHAGMLEKRLRGTEESLIASVDMVKELESRTVTVKLPEEAVDQVCLAAAEIHNRGNGVSDDKAQFIINRIRNYLENGGELKGAGIQVIEGE